MFSDCAVVVVVGVFEGIRLLAGRRGRLTAIHMMEQFSYCVPEMSCELRCFDS